MTKWAQNIWGSNSSRGFRLGAWGAALGAFAVWYYIDNNKPELKTYMFSQTSKEKK
jgi:hypothetical protein